MFGQGMRLDGPNRSASRGHAVCSRVLRAHQDWRLWSLVPSSTSQPATSGLWSEATPLLKEKGNVSCQALVANFSHPIRIDRAEVRPTFAAYDHPVNSPKR